MPVFPQMVTVAMPVSPPQVAPPAGLEPIALVRLVPVMYLLVPVVVYAILHMANSLKFPVVHYRFNIWMSANVCRFRPTSLLVISPSVAFHFRHYLLILDLVSSLLRGKLPILWGC